MTDLELLKPNSPLPQTPNGYMTLEGYSNIRRFWDILGGLYRAGLRIEVPGRTPPEQCRRRIHGLHREGAGGLLDVAALSAVLEEEDAALESFNLVPEARAAVSEFLVGNLKPLQLILSGDYRLEFDLTLGFTRSRSLVLKAEALYRPKLEPAPFPEDWKLRASRLGKDEYRVLLERASGAISRIPR